MIIDIQLSPAVEPWPSLRDGVLAAEAGGFGTAWVFDHFAGDVLRGSTMLECFTLLGALSAATTTIGLGSLVVNVANRNPAVMAASAASVQHVSGGRFTLGIGAGAAPNTAWSAEHRQFGLPLEPTVALRHRRLDAALDELDRWWAPDRPAELAPYPLPRPRPAVVLGVNSAGLAAMAGRRCDGLNVRSEHPELAVLLDTARAARTAREAREGTPGRPFDVSVWAMWDAALADPSHPDRIRWAELGVTRLVLVWLDPHDPRAVAHFFG